ncbi:MAG: nuclear transport factor 2 family protein [Rhizobacter sp.]|nr:nuclear transport factor 2 family protein [Ferruginibacter sp.]
MDANEQLISNFYTAFQKRDAATMNACYSDDIVFYDPVFELLEHGRAKDMWEMLCKNAKDLTITYGNIKDLGDDYYNCDWVATYTFSQTGRKVVNNVKAHMKIQDGKIVEHSDAFSLHKWSAQALGFSGWLLGWNAYFRRKIKNKATRNLIAFIERKAD